MNRETLAIILALTLILTSTWLLSLRPVRIKIGDYYFSKGNFEQAANWYEKVVRKEKLKVNQDRTDPWGPSIKAEVLNDNLITNGSFESWWGRPKLDPYGWTRLFNIGVVERSDSIKHSGTYSVKYTRTENNANAYQDIPNHTAYQAMTCFGWVYAQKLNTLRIVIDDGIQASYSPWNCSENQWKRLSVTHVLSEKASRLRVILDVSGSFPNLATAGTYGYFDDIECKKATRH
jgi:hypothetical protein